MIYVLLGLIFFLASTIPTKKGKSLDWMKGNTSHRGRFTQNQSIAENSMSAFNASLAEGIGIELDVRITNDKQLIVFHDRRLTRMCGVDLDVEVEDLATIQQYTLGNSDDTIPTLKEVLSLVDGKVNIFVEIKPTKNIHEICQLIADELDNYHGHFSVCSFDPRILLWFKDHRKHYVRGQIIRDFITANDFHIIIRFILSLNGFNIFTRADYVNIQYKLLPYYEWMRLFSGFVCVWAVSSEEVFNKIKNKVDGILVEFIHDKK